MSVFEDFVPIADGLALISTGPTLDALDGIALVEWTVEDERVVLGEPTPVFSGADAYYAPVRLGGWFCGRLIYSDRTGIMGAHVDSETAHQPFLHEGSLYYTDDWPHVRIYRDGELYLDHFGGMIQVGNPCWGGGMMYLEARDTDAPDRPTAWQVWRQGPGGEPEHVCQGANPAWWDGHLFVGTWNGRGFDYHRREP